MSSMTAARLRNDSSICLSGKNKTHSLAIQTQAHQYEHTNSIQCMQVTHNAMLLMIRHQHRIQLSSLFMCDRESSM